MKIEVFGKTWTLTCKIQVKVTILMKTWNDPTVITVILPQPVWLETPIEVQFLTKVLKRIFPKVWDSVWGLYSTIWRNSCGNFDENSIRTRLAWSQEPNNQQNILNEYLYSSSFGGRRQRRQPVNAPRQGSALPSTACQISPNVVPTLCLAQAEKKCWAFFFSESDLHTLTLCLKGWGRPWETLPLKNSPFLTAFVWAMLPKRRFPSRFCMFFSECVVLPARQRW